MGQHSNLKGGLSPQKNRRALLETALRALDARNMAEAVQACSSLNKMYPDFADGWAVGSQVALTMGNLDKGLEFIDRALKLNPRGRGYWVTKAECLYGKQNLRQAVDCAKRAIEITPNDAQILSRVGNFFSHRCENHAEAKTYFEKALRLDPNNATFLYNLGAVQRFLGMTSEAEISWNKALQIKPDEFAIYIGRADLRRQTADSNHTEEMERVVNAGISDWRDRTQLHYALTKEYEDLEEFELAFQHLKTGADLRRSHMKYDVADDIEVIDKIKDVFDSTAMKPDAPGCQSSEPIFIVGLPRSGTTLVERILGSHSDVFAAGELNNFAICLVKAARETSTEPGRSRLDLVSATAKVDFEALGQSYLDSTRDKTGQTPRFIDKLPLNFLYCGLIHKALPNAKIIHVRRHPLDSVYAVYKRMFKDAYPMSYDLSDMARYYVAYSELMDHWQKVMPGVICDLQYENLVDQQTTETRRLLEYCELGWQDACMNFEKNPEASTTASATQVRRPIYKSSVALWENYREQLESARLILEGAGIEL